MIVRSFCGLAVSAGSASPGAAGYEPINQGIPSYVRPVNQKYLSMTVNAFPNSANLRMRSALPLGLVVRPLATPPPGEREPVVVRSARSLARSLARLFDECSESPRVPLAAGEFRAGGRGSLPRLPRLHQSVLPVLRRRLKVR